MKVLGAQSRSSVLVMAMLVFANGEQDGRQIEDAIHGDRDASRTITEVTDGEQDLCEALADGEEDSTEATEDVSAGEVSDDQERCTQDISTCYPCDCVANLRPLASSSHRDGSIYTGCRYWQKHFRIADRSEDLEENQTDEDREYREEYGDDYTEGSTEEYSSEEFDG
ncbi:uncharacterized protein [Miscanthus floridulus]|uniref:uncharacterized protein isoform X2 n=1 Tax=Miscanthus floridulus TaxID=154761 RepID=UPI00345A5458